jgi:ATP synthase protein I
MAVIGGTVAGTHGAISAGLGGVVGIIGGLAFTLVAWAHERDSAGRVLIAAFRAEGAKIVVLALLLWLVLSTYEEAVVGSVIAAFVISIVIFSMAICIRDN